MNQLAFSPLTDEALLGAAIHHAAFGGVDGYVIAQEAATALHRRRTGERWAFPNDAYARDIELGTFAPLGRTVPGR